MYIGPNEKIQLDQEATYAEGGAATVQLAGVSLSIEPQVEAEQVVDRRGDAMPAHQAIIKRRWSEGQIEGLLAYDTANLLLDSMFGLDASSPHAYIADLDQSVAPASICLYYGQAGLIYKAAGCLPSTWEISGSSNEAVKHSWKFFGQPVVDGASLAALSDPAPVFAMGHHCSLYLDPIASAAGTTLLTDLGFSFKAIINGGRKPIWHLSNQAPDTYRHGRWGGSLMLSIEATTAMLSYLGDILDATVNPLGLAARIRMTDGSKIFDLDFAGQAIKPPKLMSYADEIVTVDFELMPVYSAQAAFLSCWKASLTLP